MPLGFQRELLGARGGAGLEAKIQVGEGVMMQGPQALGRPR